ncbi:cyclic-phosphate processing receiver domain-containing protein [Mycobacteroides abscessus]|uniref:cyclic-phosphate processing receiver domain-containing protein n=1 Tax=Mycobacteroides abscessus TaxID=36809 RepID=UPI000C256F50|nr:cyclic-phosphate processing receiver domain-containing protein [Mycobacteroides abscessus]
MKLWVDDERTPPDSWVWAKTSNEALNLLDEVESVEALSLDHDLGGEGMTRPVVLWLAELGDWPERVYAHTANPVGRQ